MFRKWLRSYFYFSKKERRAIVLLLLLIIIFAISPRIFPFVMKPRAFPVDTAFIHNMQSVRQASSANKSYLGREQAVAPEASLFGQAENTHTGLRPQIFDPNTVSEAVLISMGLRIKLVRTLLNYRNKGGRFRKASDLARIYGMDEDTYQQLAPYVQIHSFDEAISAESKNTFPYQQPTSSFKASAAASYQVDINTADTTDWKRLPGIGSRLAFRIVNFREKLGGFVSVSQVAETYALPDSTFQLIRSKLVHRTSDLRTLNVNAATLQELQQHPYISYATAKAIVAYRAQHGSFSRVEDLRRIMLLTDSAYQKMYPYLRVQDKKIP